MTFARDFELLSGHAPFPWQRRLYTEFADGRIRRHYDLPTGLGKTSIIPIWLLALAHHAAKHPAVHDFPRRLVYVVNRRTVVDQATVEAERIQDALRKPELDDIAASLRSLAVLQDAEPIAVSTLRGQLADNAEWRMDPSRPAIVLGTVDMIGSRLLFAAYGRGFKSKPLHAGSVGQDCLLVHDEAHLEPAFQCLLEAVEAEQVRCRDLRPIRVAALTATSRADSQAASPFRLDDVDLVNSMVSRRIRARKGIRFSSVDSQSDLADAIANRALEYKDSDAAVLLFVRKLEDFDRVVQRLSREKCDVEVLTGTMRGLERERLTTMSDRFARFMPEASRPLQARGGTVYLVCTSAGEVGIDISADHLVSDLVPFDSMAQRFGRVNRFGLGDAAIDVIYRPLNEGNPFEHRCTRTLALLQQLPFRSDSRFDASPSALADLPEELRIEAFTPEPEILASTDVLFDAWSLTTIRDRIPGRPPVADWLHGVAEWEPPGTYVAWRKEVELITGDLLNDYPPRDLLDVFPFKPLELLRDRTDRVLSQIKKLAQRDEHAPVWIVEAEGEVTVTTLEDLATRDRGALGGCTIVLPPCVGGLTESGTFDGSSTFSDEREYDVSTLWVDRGVQARCRIWQEETPGDSAMRLVRAIDLQPQLDEGEQLETRRRWSWYVRTRTHDDEISPFAVHEQALDIHHGVAAAYARELVNKLSLPRREASAVTFAASVHDLGKARDVWQRSIWNTDLARPLAKSGHRRPPRDLGSYRHEFGSILDAPASPEWDSMDDDARDLAVHLIAAHHGRARPHFPDDEAFDPQRSSDEAVAAARETPCRFARLQRKYGRWGLAYLESLVRAADALASGVDPTDGAAITSDVARQET